MYLSLVYLDMFVNNKLETWNLDDKERRFTLKDTFWSLFWTNVLEI